MNSSYPAIVEGSGTSPMWFIISGDGDIDYTNVYGPYKTEAEAEVDLPEDTDDISYRTVELQTPADLKEDASEADDEIEFPEPLLMDTDPITARVNELTALYGTVESIPAPNADVHMWATWQRDWTQGELRTKLELQEWENSPEGQAALQLLEDTGGFEDHRPEAEQVHADPEREIEQAKADLARFEQLVAKHAPAEDTQ